MHVDLQPGDRAAACRGLMRPIALLYEHGDFIVVHECVACGVRRRNRTAPNDSLSPLLEQPRPTRRE